MSPLAGEIEAGFSFLRAGSLNSTRRIAKSCQAVCNWATEDRERVTSKEVARGHRSSLACHLGHGSDPLGSLSPYLQMEHTSDYTRDNR